MVLEEEMPFQSPEQARIFTSFLKKLGISARVRPAMRLHSRLMLSGESASLIGLCREVQSLLTEESDTDDEQVLMIEEAIGRLEMQRDILARTFRDHAIGEVIGSSVLALITRDELPGRGEEEESLELIHEIYQVRLLHLNNLVEYEGDQIILARTIRPEEAILTIFADEVPIIPHEMITSFGIRISLHASDQETGTVLIGPEIVLLEDLSPLTAFFEEYPQDDDEDLALISRIQAKQVIIAEIIRMIEQEEVIDAAEISSVFGEYEIQPPDNGGDLSVITHISPGYIRAVIEDLRASGILRGEDNRIRLGA